MKIRFVVVLFLALTMATPDAFPCGGSSGGGGGGKEKHHGQNPGRQKWTRKRIKELKGKMKDYEKGQRTADQMDSFLDGIDGHGGRIAVREGSNQVPRALRVRKPQNAQERLYMFRRFEFLALKKERKGLSMGETVEMHALRSVLANSGGSGRD